MNILKRELRVNLNNLIVWTVILAGLGILVMVFFPSLARQAATLEKVMSSLPRGVLLAFGLEKISMADIMGFYATNQYTTVTLLGSIYAILLSSSMLSKEESEKTIEFLLSKPVRRRDIVTSKLLAVAILIIAFNLLITLIMYITLLAVKTNDFSMKIFLLLSLGSLLLHLTFAAIGYLLSALAHRNSPTPLGLAIVLVTYFLAIASALSSKLDFLKYLSPFKYVDAVDILTKAAIPIDYLLLMAIIDATAIALTYFIYQRKDFAI